MVALIFLLSLLSLLSMPPSSLPGPRTQPGGSEESAHGLVTIKMKPDEGGKFGFNVKGGADQNLPVLVSRVAPNTPADRCYPRLNEGDQVRTTRLQVTTRKSRAQVQ